MYLGQLVEVAPTDELYYAPKHPYSEALMSAIPVADPDVVMEPILLTGELPNPANPPSGCRFHTRCHYADEKCRTTQPELKPTQPGHFVACHYAEQLHLKGARDYGAGRLDSRPGSGEG